MRVAIAVLALAAGSTSVFLACSDDPPASSSGASPDGGGAVDTGTADAPATGDAGGVLYSPTGCIIKNTDYVTGKKAENVARTDIANAADWTNVDGALSEDGKFATVTLADGQESAILRVSDFGVNLPATAETWGLEVELKRRAPDGGVEDSQINVEIEGKPTRFKFVKGTWPTSIVGTHHYGQAIDTWGIDLVPGDVSKASFAATLTVKRAPNTTGPVTAIVDALKVAVHFCPEPAKK